MRITKTLAASLLALSAPAFADFMLDFERVGNLAKVGGLYDTPAYGHKPNPGGVRTAIRDADQMEIAVTSLPDVEGNCATADGDTHTGVSCWGTRSISFSGSARYISFEAFSNGSYLFDNMQFSSSIPPGGNDLHEPTGPALGLAALAALGALGALALSRRRR